MDGTKVLDLSGDEVSVGDPVLQRRRRRKRRVWTLERGSRETWSGLNWEESGTISSSSIVLFIVGAVVGGGGCRLLAVLCAFRQPLACTPQSHVQMR